MSKQKILTIVGIALLVIMVIVALGFKGKYDDASALLIAAQADAADQKKAADTQIDELTKQLAEAEEKLTGLQTEAEAAKTTIDTLTAEKAAAEKLTSDYESSSKETAAALAEAEAALKQMTAQYERAKADLDAKITRLNIVRGSHAELSEKYDQLVQSSAEEKAAAAAALTEAETALKQMTVQYDRTKADLDAKVTRLNIVRNSHAEVSEKYEALKKELTAEKIESVEHERYESKCGVSFVLPEGAAIGNESSKMVEIILSDGSRVKINVSINRVNLLWYDADLEAVNALTETIQIN